MNSSFQPSPSQQLLTRQATRGFTLIEILLVIAIIAALAGTVIINVDKVFGGQQEQVAEFYVNDSVSTALSAYKFHMGTYPSTEEGLEALLKKPAKKGNLWKGPYVKKEAIDPWKNPYNYRFPGQKNADSYDVWSSGPDGVSGNSDDIGNW